MFEENPVSGASGRLLRYPQILFIAYLTNLLAAGLLAILPMIGLLAPARSSAMYEAANGIDFWFLEEMFIRPATANTLQGTASPESPPWVGQLCLLAGFLAIAIPVASALPASFLSGGILLTYWEDRFDWRRFLWGCGHWFLVFLLLNVAQGLVAAFVFGGLLVGAASLSAMVGSWLNWISYPLIGLLALLWLAIFESTRLAAVSGGTRNPFRAFGQALRLIFKQPVSLFLWYGTLFASLFVIHLVFRAGLMPHLRLEWWPIVLIATQVFILLRLCLRLARWGGLVAFARRHNDRQAFAFPANP